MFKKPIRVKSNNKLKGSERKRLKQTILSQFPNLDEDQLLSIFPSKEDIFVSKIEAQNGVYVTSYCIKNKPLFFEVDKEKILYPTVFTLWQMVDLIPFMVTWPNVFEKIARGADLMLAGVVTAYGGYENVNKGQIMGVRLAGNKAAVAVGVAALSSNDMAETGMTGKGILINHFYMDNLWSLGDSSELPQIPDPLPCRDNQNSLNDSMENDTTDEGLMTDTATSNDGGVDKEEKEGEAFVQSSAEDIQGHAASFDPSADVNNIDLDGKLILEDKLVRESSNVESIGDEGNNESACQTLSPEEQMDQLLENCFFQALIDAKKAEFPMLASTFSSRFIHAACPEGQKIDVKKSQYKKMGKFFQEMENKQLVKIGELSKGVLSITEINLQNEILREFKTSDFAKAKSSKKAEELAEQNVLDSSQGIDVVELFAVSGKTQSFFKVMGCSKGQTFTSTEVRKILTEYIKDNELVDGSNKKLVILDPLLTDTLLEKNESNPSMAWDAIIERCLTRMNPCHKVIINGKESLVKKGRIENVEVKVEQRMGNKKVTLVKNLEQFGVDPNEFAHQIQHAAASSTAVSSLPGKTTGLQVLVQGNQASHVAKLLDEMRIPKKYISGLEKLKSKNKKR